MRRHTAAFMSRTIAIAALLGMTASAVPAHAEERGRPGALSALYVSYTALQAFDIYSTKHALSRDGREANPLMQHVVGNTDAFLAIKAVVVVNTIIGAERLWRTNKTAAIAVMIASNSVAAMLAARNAHTLRRLK